MKETLSLRSFLNIALFLSGLILPGLLVGQSPASNLIPNPSFEETRKKPPTFNFIRSGVSQWKTANQGNTDYFHEDNQSFSNRTPLNRFGSQEPHEGKGYAGFCIQAGEKAGRGGNFSEYLHAKLKTPLITGQKYCFTAFVSRADAYPDFVQKLGVHFSSDEIELYGKSVLTDFPPQLLFINEEGWRDTLNWMRLCQEFTATGGESWLTLGSFERHRNILSHYYVDDLRLSPMADDLDCACATPPDSAGSSWNFSNILFQFDEDILEPTSREVLERIARHLKTNPALIVEIGGHTDGLGGQTYNLDLSRRRAVAVRAALVEMGVQISRMEIRGYGSAEPIADNDSEEGRRLNRRVVLTLL